MREGSQAYSALLTERHLAEQQPDWLAPAWRSSSVIGWHLPGGAASLIGWHLPGGAASLIG